MKFVKGLMVVTALLMVVGCSTRLGQFTAASTMNVRNLDYSLADKSTARTSGDSCIHIVLFFIPIGDFNDRIQRAMDDAIQNGRDRGLDGDLLVNTRIDNTAWTAGVYGQNCITVEGDLVTIDKQIVFPLRESPLNLAGFLMPAYFQLGQGFIKVKGQLNLNLCPYCEGPYPASPNFQSMSSPQDQTVPYEAGERLFAKAHGPKTWVATKGAHIITFQFAEYQQRMLQFMAQLPTKKRN